MRLEDAESLLGPGCTSLRCTLHLQDVETNRLGERPALTHSHHVALLDEESRGAVGGEGLVPLFVPPVLGDVAKVVAADHHGPVHLGGNDDTLEDAAADAHVAGEGALLVDIGALQERKEGKEAGGRRVYQHS